VLELVNLSFHLTRNESRKKVERPQYRPPCLLGTVCSFKHKQPSLSISNTSIRFRSGTGSVLSPLTSLGRRQRSMTGRGNR
jgi:hypothetical protein